MKAPDYKNITYLELECTCTSITLTRWERLMKGHVRANYKQINMLVKRLLPDLYHDLALNFYNPYHYHRTSTHLILVHSGIEYFMRYE